MLSESFESRRMKKVLFIIGSPNQTIQMHKIASCMPEYDCYFSQFFSNNPIINFAVKTGFLDHTILAGQFKEKADHYLKEHGLKNDYALSVYNNQYDLVVLCSDVIVPSAIKHIKKVWVQEGMTDHLSTWSKVVKALKIPRYFAVGTSLNGTSDLCDIYCAASPGYKKHFQDLGTKESKIIVTGMPNFDHASAELINDFPHKDYVLVATSDIRECFGTDDREKFIKQTAEIAAGRKLIFKLHPNEIQQRAVREIEKFAPEGTLIYTSGNVNHMIANCDELITQYSTVVYVGLALNKKVHSYFDLEDLKRKMPIQNGGQSGANIAEICKRYIQHQGDLNRFLNELPSLDLSQVHVDNVYMKTA